MEKRESLTEEIIIPFTQESSVQKFKILLVNSGSLIKQKKTFRRHANYPPLGLCYIAAVLEQEKYRVEILDARTLEIDEEEFRKKIEESMPDIIGLVAYVSNHSAILKAAEIIKEVNPNAVVIIGGPEASVLKERFLKESENFDFSIFGEAEPTFLELCNALQYNKPFKDIKGLIYKNGPEIIQNEPREFVQNIDEFPIPARHLLPNIADSKFYGSSFRSKRKPMTSMVTSRGCPFSCIFCYRISGQRFRAHSARRVVDEVKQLIEKFGIKEVHFFDDLFIANVQRLKEICKLLIEEKVDITWSCNGRVDIISKNKEIVPLMKKAGCWYMSFGLESGNQKVLDYLKKGITLEQSKTAVEWVNKNSIRSGGYFILGSPIDTKETIMETIEFAKSIPLDTAQFGLMSPYEGTEIYEIVKKEGGLSKVDPNEWTPSSGEAPYVPPSLTSQELFSLQKQAYREFMFRPKYMLRQLKNITNLNILKNYIKTGIRFSKIVLLGGEK